MELLDVIRGRRSINQFQSDPVPDSVLEEMLQAAVWVPNHHLSEPWHFMVIRGQSLRQMADFRKAAVLVKNREKPQAERIAEKARDDLLKAPCAVVAVQTIDENPYRAEEDYASTAMAVYNMTLVANSHQVGTYWHTGPLVYFEPFREWLGLDPLQRIVAYLRVGYPRLIPQGRRTDGLELTRWLD